MTAAANRFPPVCYRLGGALALACVAGTAWLRGEEPVPTAPHIVELPPFIVSEAAKPWRYAAGTGMELLSRCSDDVTRQFWERHERLTKLSLLVLPAELQFRKATPDLILIVNNDTASSLSRELVTKPTATPEQPNDAADAGRIARQMNATIKFMPNVALDDVDSRAVFGMIDEKGFSADTLIFSAERTRYVLRRRVPPLPQWFIEGYLRLEQDMAFSNTSVTISRLMWLNPPETWAIRADADHPRVFIPLAELFDDARVPVEPERRQLWSYESALLLRWALDDGGVHRDGLWRFIAQTATTPATDGMFRECVGLGYSDVLEQLSDYLLSAIKNPLTLRPAKLAPLPTLRLRDATEAEVARIKGEWERLEIRLVRNTQPDYASRYIEQARRTLGEAYAHGIRDPQMLATMGVLEVEVGTDDLAKSYLVAAVDNHCDRPRAYAELARINYQTALRQLSDTNARLGAETLNNALAPLAAAHALSPPQLGAYVLMAEAWSRQGALLHAPQFALLDEGVRDFPHDGALLYYVAFLRAAHGFNAEAAALIERGLALKLTVTGEARFRALQKAVLTRLKTPESPR